MWNLYDGDLGLGHAVTAVGYIPQGDVLDPGPTLPGIMAPTDWVIVHDNWASTPRNVIIPFDFLNNWVANTYAFPDPGFLQLTNIVVVRRTNAVVSLTGIPGCCHDLLWKTNLLTTNVVNRRQQRRLRGRDDAHHQHRLKQRSAAVLSSQSELLIATKHCF